jgi:hypothetical protein
MGRPIKKRFIGVGSTSQGTGGEGVASLAAHGGNSYSAGTTITFPTLNLVAGGGSAATATIAFVTPAVNSLQGNGNVSSVTLTSAGSGYIVRNVKATFTKPANVVVDGVTGFYGLGAVGTVVKFSSGVTTGIYAGMVANVFFTTLAFGNPTRVVSVNTTTGNITFSTANTAAISSPISFGDVGFNGNVVGTTDAAVTTGNTIQANANISISAGGSGGRLSDITSVKGSRRYRVTNDQGTDTVRLIKSTECGAANTAGGPPTYGTMTISATDSTGGTYWVTKLDGRTATITPGGSGPGTEFSANAQAIWSMNAAVVNTTVKLATND